MDVYDKVINMRTGEEILEAMSVTQLWAVRNSIPWSKRPYVRPLARKPELVQACREYAEKKKEAVASRLGHEQAERLLKLLN